MKRVSLAALLLSAAPAFAQTPANPPVVAVAAGTTGAVVATMAANANWKNWICGFDVSGTGASAAAMSPITVAGTQGGSLVYQGVNGGTAAAPVAPFIVRFNPCVPASAVNTAITVTTTAAALGAGAAVDVQAYGFTGQ